VAKIRQLTQENGLQLYALCNDYIIDNDLIRDEVVEQNLNLLDISATLGCGKYILPLFEKSELTSKSVDKYRESLSAIADKAADLGVVVCLETILTGNELLHMLDIMGQSALAVVYDTGNRVAFGHDLPGDIRLLNDAIKHVHIKDKNAENENVLLGTGLVNFHDVFLALAEIDYLGNFTFEAQRGSNPVNTARYNINLVNFFISEGFSV